MKQLLGILLSIICAAAFAQKIPSMPFGENPLMTSNNSIQSSENPLHTSMHPLLHQFQKTSPPIPRSQNKNYISGDTLYVMNDTTISGSWNHGGCLFIFGTAHLTFNSADCNIYGDLVVWGTTARVDINNSTMRFPQQYFYQRNIIVAGGASLHINNSTLDYSGLSHNLSISDSAKVFWSEVNNIGFTTCGMWSKAEMNINGTNQAGEYIMTQESQCHFRNANTILLWHHFAEGASVNHSFPEGDTVNHYDFSSATLGVSGVNFLVEVDSCTEVMWGMMPEPLTNISISNSEIRAIGLWFNGDDTLDVNGLVNQTQYVGQTMNIPDRNLQLTNTSVRTWSIYSFDASHLNITGSIVGEIGCFGRSNVINSGILVDGSGGYLFASDTSLCIASSISSTTSVRSERHGMMIFGYSTLNMGTAEALGNSILLVAQTPMLQDPIYRDMAVVWYGTIEGPNSVIKGDSIAINGSAWIDKDPMSPHMDFAWKQMFYKSNTETNWTAMGPRTYNESRHDTLCVWNTSTLTNEGMYEIKLVICDNSLDSNKLEAMFGINVLPEYMGIEENDNNIVVYPNPATDQITIESPKAGVIQIYNTSGQKVLEQTYVDGRADISLLAPGAYLLVITDGENPLKTYVIKE